MLDKNKVVIGMSGGIDSTIAAYLLKEQGYEVIGVCFNLFGNTDIEKEAAIAAKNLGVDFHAVELIDYFNKHVQEYLIDEYLLGKTPNPCVECNKHVKFEMLMQLAEEYGAYYIATGHYADILYNEEKEKYVIKKSKAGKKDQTYMLYNLTQTQLEHILMPLAKMNSKDEVRAIAEKLSLSNAKKSDSQEICFIPDDDYVGFIKKHRKVKIVKGSFVDAKGVVLGEHQGIVNYTIGQRKGLGIALGRPRYVTHINPQKNQVVLGDNEDLFSKELVASNNNYIYIDPKIGDRHVVHAMIRYNGKLARGILEILEDKKAKIIFDEPQRAITPGQSVVYFQDDLLFGGGIIL